MEPELIKEALNIDSFPCTYVKTKDGSGEACHMHLDWIDPEKLPTVSILTPTYNRQLFEDLMLRNWNSIDYPRHKLEWIIVDDSDKTPLTPSKFNKYGIRYIRIGSKITIGKKRNFLAALANNEILVHMDDDDFYPPENVISRVKTIVLSEGKECVGCNKTLCYDLIHDQTFEAFDPSDTDLSVPCTISESTLAYTKQFWEKQKYSDDSKFAECIPFIKDRHDKIILIPYIFVVTQLSHSNNTVKRWMLKSTKHTVQFTDNLSMMDNMMIQDLRAKVILEFPEWQKAINFVKKNYKNSYKNFIKILEKSKFEYLKTNPFVIDHIRNYQTTSLEKEIVYYCGPGKYLNFSNVWDGNSVGLGGSEEAVVNLSEQFVKLGYTVTVYNLVPKKIKINGVIYKPYYKWLPKNKVDLTILWRDPSHLDTKINSKTILDLHDVIDPNWLSKERMNNNPIIYYKSEFHKSLVPGLKDDRIGREATVPHSDCVVIPNGINSEQFKSKEKRESNIIMSTSSPDRCITALLNALPIIRSEPGLENTEVHWAYGFKSGITKGGMEEHNDPKIRDWVTNVKQRIKETPGFVDLGRISHPEVVKLCKKSNIFAYGTNFPEIDCISMTKAMAGGAVPVVTSCGALTDKLKYFDNIGIKEIETKTRNVGLTNDFDYSITDTEFDMWVSEIIKTLKKQIKEDQRSIMTEKVLVEYDWGNIASRWITLLHTT